MPRGGPASAAASPEPASSARGRRTETGITFSPPTSTRSTPRRQRRRPLLSDDSDAGTSTPLSSVFGDSVAGTPNSTDTFVPPLDGVDELLALLPGSVAASVRTPDSAGTSGSRADPGSGSPHGPRVARSGHVGVASPSPLSPAAVRAEEVVRRAPAAGPGGVRTKGDTLRRLGLKAAGEVIGKRGDEHFTVEHDKRR